MSSPKEVIEKIRKIRFQIGLDTRNLTPDQKAALRDKEKVIKDAARLAREIDTKTTQFIFELIQNAEDNDYEQSEAPKIKFITKSDKLIIQNNEKGFKGENVWALCGVGESTKEKALGYIGEKGIGFKSVFMISDNPHIYSNGFRFQFKREKEKPESIIIPHWINDLNPYPSFVDPTQTNIVLPLKLEEKSKIKQYIDQIHPSLLLFLKKLKIIEIEDKIQYRHENRKIKRYDHNGLIEIEHGEKKSYWRAIKKTLEDIPEQIKEERLRGIHSAEIIFPETDLILAFPLNEDGGADASSEQSIFAFLPIRKYGFKFIIQADFLLIIGREDIIKDNEWNKWLRDSIVLAFLDAVNEFKVDKKLRYTFYNYLPLEEVKDDFFLPVVEQIYENLQNAECILTETGIWKKPSDVLLIENEEIRKLVSNEDLKSFYSKEYLSSEIKAKAKKSILRKLGVEEFFIENLIKCLENTEWVKKQSDDWLVFLYEYLSKQKLTDDLLECLQELYIIRLENGKLTSIKEGVVFFPLDKKGKDYGFENELRIAKRNITDLIAKREKQKKELKILGFLRELGIQSHNPYEIIENHILPIYEDGRWKKKGGATLLGYVRYIKDNIKRYEKESNKLNARKESWETKEDILGRLKKSLFIHIDKMEKGINYYDLPENVYLPKIYGNENDLETLLEGIKDIGKSFVHACYIEDIFRESKERINLLRDTIGSKDKKWKKNRKKYAEKSIEEPIKKVEEERDKKIKGWRDFFLKIGVNSGFKVGVIISLSETYLDWEMQSKLRGRSSYTNYTDQEITDYKLIPLKEILTDLENRQSQKKAKLLLFLLINQWTILSQYIELTYGWKYYSWNSKTTDATWVHLLKTSSWLPTSQGTLAKPSDVFLDIPEIREMLGDIVPYLTIEIKNDDFIKSIGINTEANVEGILNYLKVLVERKSNEKSRFEMLYEFLDKHFGDDEGSIKNAFSESALIFIPNTEKKFFASHEVLWKDVSDIFGKNRGYLEKHYKLKSFFVEKLGISKKPSPKDYSSVLVDLSQKKKIDKNDEKIILKIYKELNEHLNPEKVEIPISEEEWWEDFIEGSIFWTDKKKFWRNNGNVLINDDQELYDLFKDNYTIAFFELPKNYHPKIQHFIKEAGISYLSKAVQELPIDEAEKFPEQSLTDQIREFAPYILRYLYKLEYNTYEKLKKEGVLTQLNSLTCYSVKSLQVGYTLNGESASAKQIAHLCNGNLYVQSSRLKDIDYLAVELSKLFGELRGLDDFLISLFDKKTEDKIQNLLRAKGIQELPEDEREWLGIERHISAEGEALEEKEEKGTEKEESGQDKEQSGTEKVSGSQSERECEEAEIKFEEHQHKEKNKSIDLGVKEEISKEQVLEGDVQKEKRSGEETPSPENPPKKTSLPETQIRETGTVITERQIRSSKLANLVKESYSYHCQICLSRENPEILTYNKSYAGQEENRKALMEAHHIKEVAKDQGHDHPGNYLSLCHHHHALLHKLNLSLDNVKDSLSNVVDKEIVWPNGEIVRWNMLTLSNEFVEGNHSIQIVINQEHLEKLKEYLGIIYKTAK